MYVIAGLVTAWFITGIIRSVWIDLFRAPVDSPLAASAATVAACADEADALLRQLTSHSDDAVASTDRDWDAFSARYEQRFAQFQSRCVDVPIPGVNDAVLRSFADTAVALEALRMHLSRCGAEGDRDRKAVTAAVAQVRAAARATGP